MPRDVELTAHLRARALWLRSRGRGVLAGYSASALHGAKWIGPDLPASIIYANSRREPGVQTWEDRIEPDEICLIDGMRVTTAERTALDLASRLPLDTAVAAVDALVQATDVKVADVELWSSGIGAVAASRPPELLSTWSTAARSHRRRRGCGCY